MRLIEMHPGMIEQIFQRIGQRPPAADNDQGQEDRRIGRVTRSCLPQSRLGCMEIIQPFGSRLAGWALSKMRVIPGVEFSHGELRLLVMVIVNTIKDGLVEVSQMVWHIGTRPL